jgi:hypothetical protein
VRSLPQLLERAWRSMDKRAITCGRGKEQVDDECRAATTGVVTLARRPAAKQRVTKPNPT